MTEKPRILLLTSSFPRSRDDETCSYIREFAKSLTKELSVTVLTFPDARAREAAGEDFRLLRARSRVGFHRSPLQASVDFHELATAGLFSKWLATVSMLIFFWHALKASRQAEIICSHWMLPCGLIGALLSRLLRKPHFIVEHSGALHLLRRLRGGTFLARLILRGTDRIVVVSSDLKQKLLALCPREADKIEIISMGVDVDCGLAIKDGNPLPATGVMLGARLLFLGRLVEIKGLQVLLKALQTHPDIRLFVAGDGEKREEMEQLARDLSIDATFLGQVGKQEKEQLFSVCDVVVIPSLVLPDGRTEGMPVVALEALAAGLPVLASRVGGLSEIIIDGHNGYLFEAGNDQMLAKTIAHLVSDSAAYQKLSANAERTALSYDWRVIGARYTELSKTLIRTNGTSEPYQTAQRANS